VQIAGGSSQRELHHPSARPRSDTCAARSAGVVELVFANIGVYKRMHRFTLRTKLKVDVQWTRTPFALVHNLGKMHTFEALH
jgi:hypothetical protein